MVCLFFVFIQPCHARSKPLRITGIENEQTHAMAAEILKIAYQKIGCRITVDVMPGRRSLAMANNGDSDGDIARILGTENAFPNLVRVPTPIIWFTGAVFSKTVNKSIRSWEDLKGLRIGIIRGVRYSRMNTQGMAPFFAENMHHLFRLLTQDKIEVAVAVLKAGQIEINKNFKDRGIRVIGRPLTIMPLYHFVHKSHKTLVPRLDAELSAMKTRGEMAGILDQAFNDLMGQQP